MAWRSSSKPPPPASAFSKLVPLVILFLVIGGLAFVGLQIYAVVNNIADTTNKKLEKKNVTFTKDGMKVGIKEIKTERYVDQTQSVLVKAWNYSSWPAYKSRFWNQEGQKAEAQKSESRKPYSRSASSSSVKA